MTNQNDNKKGGNQSGGNKDNNKDSQKDSNSNDKKGSASMSEQERTDMASKGVEPAHESGNTQQANSGENKQAGRKEG